MVPIAELIEIYYGQCGRNYDNQMIPVLRNRPEYQIQIDEKCPYPFNGPKPERFMASVKLLLPMETQNSPNQQSIKKILQLDNEVLIKIYKITESHLKKCYTIIYEYVPYHLNYPSSQFQSYIKSGKYKAVLFQLFKQMIQIGIRPCIQPDVFGFDDQFNLRMFLKPNIQCLVNQNQSVEKLANGLVVECQKIFANIENGINFKNKVTNLSQKIKKIQNQILTKQPKKRQKKSSQSGINSSENSDSQAKTGENEKIGNAHWRFDHDFHFQDSYSVRDSKNRRKKRSSSFKDGQKPKSEAKQKKASWQGSWKQQKLSNGESDKMTVLKKRISQALFKTQKTLTKYEKIRSRTDRKKYSNQNKLQ